MLEFWLSFPLRGTLKSIYLGNTVPKAVLEIPNYLKIVVNILKNLKEVGAIGGDEETVKFTMRL